MKIINKIFIASCLTLCCLSCTKIIPYYKPEIQQGNVIAQDEVSQLHKNMSKQDVIALLGTPVVQNTYNDNRLVYVNTRLPNRGKYTEKQLILSFKDDKLISASGDYDLPKGLESR
jgi:outer membrane protein assembly factor BamE